jgi:GDP-mannose 6-dehydrogenase
VFTADHKLNISPSYLKPGFAFGGSCLPKDLRAINYRAKELDLKLPLFEAVLPSNHEHLERALELILDLGHKRIGMMGLSFKAATDDLRESPHVELVKRLLGEGREIRIWDDNVSLGRLVGSNRAYIEQVIPHIGSLLCAQISEVTENSDIIVLGTSTVSKDLLREHLQDSHVVVDLVNLEASRRLDHSNYNGICW